MPPKRTSKTQEFPDLEKPYRRGLILGLSLAEIFLLLVFLLLLVAVGYAGIVEEEKKKNKEALEIGQGFKEKFPTVSQKEYEELFIILKEQIAEKENLVNQLKKIFDAYEQQKSEIIKLKKEIKELKKTGGDVKKLQDLLSEKNDEIGNLNIKLEKLTTKLEKLEKKLNELETENTALKKEVNQLKDELNKLRNLIDKDLKKEIDKLTKKNKELENKKNELKGKLDDLEKDSKKDKKIKGVLLDLVGDGTLKIACWNKFDDKLGRLRSLNIFDILITNKGIVIHNRGGDNFLNLNEVEKRKKLIPMSRIQFDKVLSVNEFLFQTEPMYKHGQNRKGYFSDKLNEYVEIPCIYNVQVFDQTTNDTIRRRLLENGLDQRFNLFKVKDEKWPH